MLLDLHACHRDTDECCYSPTQVVANSIIAALTAKWQETADFRAFTVYVTGASGPLSACFQVLLQVTTCSPKDSPKGLQQDSWTRCCSPIAAGTLLNLQRTSDGTKNNGTTARTLGFT
jgi:hypothetical protein